MGETVVANFFGICTHMSKEALEQASTTIPPGPEIRIPEFRVVLVDASADTINNSRLHVFPDMPPHVAKLQLRIEDIWSISDINTTGFVFEPHPEEPAMMVWRLNNVILSIANAMPGEMAAFPEPPNVLPSLSELSGDTLGLPSVPLTLTPIPTRAACYFDFFSGTVECRSFGLPGNEAAVGHVTCETIGNPQLRVRSFDPNAATISIILKPGTTISVSNLPEGSEGDDDFFLHFLNAASFPSGTLLIPPPCTCPPVFDTPNPDPAHDNRPIDLGSPAGISPSCSNSTFP